MSPLSTSAQREENEMDAPAVSAVSRCSGYAGRVGALAVVFGVGAAIASMPAAIAESASSSGPTASNSSSQSGLDSSGVSDSDSAGSAGAPADAGDTSADPDGVGPGAEGRAGAGVAIPKAGTAVVIDDPAAVLDPGQDLVSGSGDDADLGDIAEGVVYPDEEPALSESATGTGYSPGAGLPRSDRRSRGGASSAGSDAIEPPVVPVVVVPADESAPDVVPAADESTPAALVEPARLAGEQQVGSVAAAPVVADIADVPNPPVMTATVQASPAVGSGTRLLPWRGLSSGGGSDIPAAAPLAWAAAAFARREIGSNSSAAADQTWLFGDGTAEHPNAGILFGNGFSWDAGSCIGAVACDGGAAGLLGGRGGDGFNGGDGGSAGWFGNGGNGGRGLPGGNGGDGGRGGLISGRGGDGGDGGDALVAGGAAGRGGQGGTGGLFGADGQPGDDGAASPNQAPAITGYRIDGVDAVTGVVTGTVMARDPEGDPLIFSGPDHAAKGVVIVAEEGDFAYTPSAAARNAAAQLDATDADKTDMFTVTVIDTRGGSATLAISVPISPAEQQPESDYRQDMRSLIIDIAQQARSVDPGFIVIPQNGQELITRDGDADGPLAVDYVAAIDGQGREDLFYGYNSDNTATPAAEREYMLEFLERLEAEGVQVLVTDYCSSAAKVDNSYAQNAGLDFISFAANHRDLDTIPPRPAEPIDTNSADIDNLAQARNFLYLLDPGGFDSRADYLDTLADTNYDVFIIDAFYEEDALTAAEVAALQTKANGGRRLVLSYLSIGEAEDYRYYWQPGWRTGTPSWLEAENPDWAGNYKVRYWEQGWRDIILGGPNAYLNRIMAAGFDGVYLDLVDAFEYFE